MTEDDWEELKYFKPSEFKYPRKMNFEFMKRLDKARELSGVPFRITSSYRPNDDKTHGLGVAVDIRMERDGTCRHRWNIRAAAEAAGISRIIFYDRHIHLDCGDYVDAAKYPSNCIGWGKSR